MTAEDFITNYIAALATQNWKEVKPLISEKASVTFSDGSVHLGKPKVRAAFENNFTSIKSEKYNISNVVWLKKEKAFAAYIFEYEWSGIINGKSVSGNGIGTSVIIKETSGWKLLAEHLGKKK